jgi:hypothetical protein
MSQGNQELLLTIKAENEASQKLDQVNTDVESMGASAERANSMIESSADGASQSLDALAGASSASAQEIADNANTASDAISDMGNEAQNAGQQIQSGADEGAGALDRLKGIVQGVGSDIVQTANEAGQKFIEFGEKGAEGAQNVITNLKDLDLSMQQTGDTAERMGDKMVNASNKAKQSSGNFALASVALVSSVANMGFALQTLGSQEEDLAKKTLEVEKAQVALFHVMNDSEATANDLALAEEKVAQAKQNYAKQQERINQANIQFGLSLVTSLATLPSMITGLKGMADGLIGMSHASRVLQLAMGPIGIMFIAIGVVMTLFVTNAFGIQDAIFKLGNDLQNFMDRYLKPLGDLFRWVYQNAIKPFLEALGVSTDRDGSGKEIVPTLTNEGSGETPNQRRAREAKEKAEIEAERKAIADEKEREKKELERQREFEKIKLEEQREAEKREKELQKKIAETKKNEDKLRIIGELQRLQAENDAKLKMIEDASKQETAIVVQTEEEKFKAKARNGGFNIHGSGNVPDFIKDQINGTSGRSGGRGENILRVIFEDGEGRGIGDYTLDLINEEAVVRMKRETTIF